jgi:energy-coupling factor transporter ATP-binding protein EcfA2
VLITGPNGTLRTCNTAAILLTHNVMCHLGSGKSSMLRVMAGLWPCSKGQSRLKSILCWEPWSNKRYPSGHVQLPSNRGSKNMYFLPQSSYLTFGSLRDQITYPSLSLNNESMLIPINKRLLFFLYIHIHLIFSFRWRNSSYSQKNSPLPFGRSGRVVWYSAWQRMVQNALTRRATATSFVQGVLLETNVPK